MRNISFALTTDQVRRREKTVTRRTRWTDLEAGTELQPVVKAMGLQKGEHVQKIGGAIRVVSVRREPLRRMLDEPEYGAAEVILEGFPSRTPRWFVAFFCAENNCSINARVTRIEFEYVEAVAP